MYVIVINLTFLHSQEDVAHFLGILFSFVIFPFVIIFLWLNAFLAIKIWSRRHGVTKSDHIFTVSQINSTQGIETRSRQQNRERRIFKVILALMAVFVICRMPNWIFIITRFNKVSTDNIYAVLHFSFGLMEMVNCMLNPFIYTFLSETIRLTTFMADIFRGLFRPCLSFCRKNNKNIGK